LLDRNLYAVPISAMRTTCLAHILPGLIILLVLVTVVLIMQ
jgi:hypothetical protein